jgi:hypothetical protein
VGAGGGVPDLGCTVGRGRGDPLAIGRDAHLGYGAGVALKDEVGTVVGKNRSLVVVLVGFMISWLGRRGGRETSASALGAAAAAAGRDGARARVRSAS